MPKITNISRGPRGVNTKSGLVFLAPGEERDLDVASPELKSLSEEWFAVGALSKAEKAQAAEAAEAAGASPPAAEDQKAE